MGNEEIQGIIEARFDALNSEILTVSNCLCRYEYGEDV